MFKSYAPPEKYRQPFYGAGAPDDSKTLKLKWLGTAGFELKYKQTTLLIDPYFTRCGLAATGFSKMVPDLLTIDKHISRADQIVIGHSHYDHLLDAPYIAQKTGATISGSATTANICRGFGLPADRIREVGAGEEIECGDFKVEFIPSLHGRIFGLEPSPGVVKQPPGWPLRFRGFKHGGVFILKITAGPYRLYHNGSANLIDEKLAGRQADLHLIGLSGRRLTRDYLARFYRLLKPRYLLPMHYDFFFEPLSEGLKLLPLVDIEGFFAEMKKIDSKARIIMPNFFEEAVLFEGERGIEIELRPRA